MRPEHTTQPPPYSESPKSILKAYEAHEVHTPHKPPPYSESTKLILKAYQAHEVRTHHTIT